MQQVCSPYFDPDFDSLLERIFGPSCSVCIDNESFEDCTLIKVDSVKKQDLLLQVVQVLADLNLTISKSYVSYDGGWFMDVFHVKDENGKKVADQQVINYIEQAIGSSRRKTPESLIANTPPCQSAFKSESNNDHTTIEMSGTDRPGLFSEISAALADLHCNIVEAHAWSHNDRLACVAYISDQSSDKPIEDPNRLADIEDHLTTVLRANANPDCTRPCTTQQQEVKTSDLHGGQDQAGTMTTNVERRLHQLMLSVRDFDGPSFLESSTTTTSASRKLQGSKIDHNRTRISNRKQRTVTIASCDEKGYSIVTIECKDRSRLMFDTVCTLTDMQYMIFHASIASRGSHAFQEYFIRHKDGRAMNTESEKERAIKCLEAAIERRVCEGVRLELCAHNRIGLLSDITRVLRENGLAVVRADVATQGETAVNAFYIKDVSGNAVDMEFVESMKREMGPISLKVENDGSALLCPQSTPATKPFRFSIGDILTQIERFSHNFIQTN